MRPGVGRNSSGVAPVGGSFARDRPVALVDGASSRDYRGAVRSLSSGGVPVAEEGKQQNLHPDGHASLRAIEVEAETLEGMRKVVRPVGSDRYILYSNEPGQPGGEDPAEPPPLFIFASSLLL